MFDSMRNLFSLRTDGGGRSNSYLKRLVLVFALLLIAFAVLRPSAVADLGTWKSMAIQLPEYGLLSLGVLIAMITAGIDLSVVGIANLSAVVAATVMLGLEPSYGAGIAIFLGVVAALAVGVVAGLLNGILISKVRIPAILATLGTFELFTGIAIVVTGGRALSGLPPSYSAAMGTNVFGIIPVPFLIFLMGVGILWYVLHRTGFGKKLFLYGSNQLAAHYTGFKSVKLLTQTYVISGLFGAAAGLVMMGNYNSAKADYGSSYLLLTVLIVVLAGVAPNGGTGTVIGVVLAVFMLQLLSSGLNAFPQVSNFYRPLLFGGLLVIAMVVNASWFGRFFSQLTNRGKRSTSREKIAR